MKSKNINACHLNVRPLPIKTILALSCVIMFTLTTLLSHLYVVLESDYLTNEIFLFTIDTVIMEVLENIVFAIVYSVIIYCAVLYTTR